MKTAITLSLLPSKPTMPFVLGPDLDQGFKLAAELGFDAIEIFPPTLDSLDMPKLQDLVQQHSLPISTIGTGGGAVAQGLTLTDSDEGVRRDAIQYIKAIIDHAAQFGGSAIIGSMQGKCLNRDRQQVVQWFAESMATLDAYAAQRQQVLLYEPLNRYETDLFNRVGQACQFLTAQKLSNTKVLADLFHMNIEETCINQSLTDNLDQIGHVHFVDSNRWPAGKGHTDLAAAFQTLKSAGYNGYLAVEAYPLPDQVAAAEQAANYFKQWSASTTAFAKRI